MSFRTITIILIAMLFLPWVSIAKAEDTIRNQEIDLQLSHDLAGNQNTNEINILEGEPLKEKDTWPDDVKKSNGVYWGNLFPSASVVASKIPHHTLYARTVIQIPEMDIATGSSGFWIRVPIDGTRVEAFSLKIDGEINEDLRYENPYDLYSWTFWNDGDTDYIIWDARGIFIYMYYALSTQYKFELSPAGNSSGGATLYDGNTDYFVFEILDATPFEGEQIVMLMTEENYQISSEYLISAHTVEDEYFWYEINPGVYLAWAFIFVRGLPSTGGFSFNFPAIERTVSYSADNSIIIKKTLALNDSYITIHLPYKGTMSWDVSVLISGAVFYGHSTIWTGTINNKVDFLSFSPAWNVSTSAIEINVDITVTLIPLSGEITLFSTFDRRLPDNFAGNYEESYLLDYRYITEDVLRVPPRFCSIWGNIYETSGAISLLTFDGEKTHLDFGWGTGYKWPGSMEVWIQLDDQTEIYWKGNVEYIYGGMVKTKVGSEFWGLKDVYLIIQDRDGDGVPDDDSGTPPVPNVDDNRTLLEKIFYAVVRTGTMIYDGIKGIISTLWSYIAKALEVIGNFVINLVGKVIAFLKQVVDFVGNILNSCIWILPPSLIMIGLAYASDFAGSKETTLEEYAIAKGKMGTRLKRPGSIKRAEAKYQKAKAKEKKYKSIGEQRYKVVQKREQQEYEKYLREKRKRGK